MVRERVWYGAAEVFDVDDCIKEVAVGEEEIDAVLFQFLGEGSETEDVDCEENGSEKTREGGRMGNGFFFAGDECFAAIHGDRYFTCQ